MSHKGMTVHSVTFDLTMNDLDHISDFDLSPLPPAHTLMFAMPVFLLAFSATIGCIPTTVVHGLLFTVVTLKNNFVNKL